MYTHTGGPGRATRPAQRPPSERGRAPPRPTTGATSMTYKSGGK